MIRKYLRERRSWILMFMFLQVLALFITYLDSSIPYSAVMYYVFLSTIIFTIFIIIRYHQEVKFFIELSERKKDTDITTLPEPNRPFEKLIEQSISQPIEELKAEVSTQHTLLEQEKDEMLAWIHEVKTPLTAMQLIIDRVEDRHLKLQLTHEWMRVHLLLDQQLHQKRMPFMENDLYMEKIELASIVYSEINTLRSWCLQKGIGFNIDLTVINVLSDSKWLSFIIRQFLTNAVKYSEKGSDISISSSKHNGQTIFTVADSGRGIEARDLQRIFDKGFTSTSQHQDNTASGMGLYLAKKVASSLHIHINVQSEFGCGTSFSLTFPKANEFVDIQGV
ncbi:sensor histidine kinase [Alteribacillus sp. YIM 98480]|uniref:sensor histidine kinase n=1 Tax=Alteribacillus sp. YIM 98480 TaxID=2606599 RepID=UPI00131A66F7|nr:sensor histidine kinase [Alteribacillus sp. YIM 98480]